MSLTAYPTLRLKLTMPQALKLQFLPAIPGSNAAAAAAAVANKVNRTGDVMTGFLTLNADPTANLHAATKQYVDTHSGGGGGGGNVSTSGTITNGQYAKWVTGTTIQSVAPATVLSDIGAQPLDADLTSIAGATGTGTTGVYYRKAANTWATLNIGSGLSLNTGTDTLTATSGGAPTAAEYITATSDATLTAERVLTNTTSVTWDFSTAGQAKANAISAGQTFYCDLTDAADVATYNRLLLTPSTHGETSASVVCTGTTTDFLIASFITDPGVPGAIDYPAGSAYRRLYGSVSGGAARFRLQVYTRTTGGVETLARDEVSNNFTDTTATLQEWLATPASGGSLAATDRLVAKISARRISGPTNVTVTLYSEGSAHASQVQTTISVGGSVPISVTPPLALSGGNLTIDLSGYQPLDADLTSLASASGTNTIYYRSAASTWSSVSIGANLTFTGGVLAAAGGGGGTTVADGNYGDVTVSGTGTVWTINDAAVALDDIQNISTNTFLGRITAGSGVTEQLTGANAKTIIGSGNLTKADDTNVTMTLGGTPTGALYSAVSMTLGWTGQLSVARGGLGVGTITGLMQGNGTGAVTGVTNSSTVGQVLRVIGATSYGWGALDLADTDAVTGSIQAASFPALTGDVTTTAGSLATTIATSAVTFAKMQTIATDSLLGRDTAATGAVENITLNATLSMTGAGALQRAALTGDVTAVAGSNATAFRSGSARSVLGVTGNAAAVLADIQGTTDQVLRVNGAGTALAFGAIDLSKVAAATGALQAASFPTLTGDVTTAGGALATTIANNAVTYAKIQDVSAASLLIGRGSAAGAGDPQEITVGTGLTMVGTDLRATSGGSAAPSPPQGRLTNFAGSPVLAVSVTGATTIYYTPYVGNQVPIYDGTNMVMTTFAELTNSTTASSVGSAGPAAVANNSNYDLFVWSNSGTPTLTRGPLWTNDTTRSAGTALVRTNGIWLNNAAITNGPAASRGTYVGTVRSNGTATIDFQFASRAASGGAGIIGVWNCYNRINVVMRVQSTDATWTYNSTTIRNAQASATWRVSFVAGLQEDNWHALHEGWIVTPAGNYGFKYIGLDGTGTFAYPLFYVTDNYASSTDTAQASLTGISLGFHYVQASESANSTGGAITFNGVEQNHLTFTWRC